MSILPKILVDDLNEDPDNVIEKLTDESLKKLVNIADYYYFNSFGSEISDNSYDALRWHARKRKLIGREDVGYLPVERLRTKLPFFMPSLNKVKADSSLRKFLQTGSKFIWTPKLDGVSGMVTYRDGKLDKVFLRGDGTIGGDISFVAKFIKLPRTSKWPDLAVRGEFVILKDVWNKIGGGGTMRNYVSGLLNSKSERNELKNIIFVAYDIVHLQGETIPSQDTALVLLEQLGFFIVDSGILENPLTADVLELFLYEHEENPIAIDGIVLVKHGPRSIPLFLHNPEDAVAFKFNLEKAKRRTEVVNIEWNISRNGKYIPVVIFKPVYIEGARIQRASGSNARRVIENWQLRRGTKIVVVRSGGVIPQIDEILDPGPTDEPIFYPPDTYLWHWKGPDIVLEDPDSVVEVQMKRAVYFFETLKVPGIREGMVKRLFDGGLDTLQKIINASIAELRSIYGIGPIKSNRFYTDIRERIRRAKLYRLMLASNTFGGTSLGKTLLRYIAISIPDFLTYEEDLYPRLINLRNIGPKRANAFIEGLDRFRYFLDDFNEVEENNRRYFEELARTGGNPKIRGRIFVLTNLQDEDLEDYIIDNGGTIANHVTDNVEAVISGNEEVITEKMQQAFKNHVKIYTVEEFKEHYNISDENLIGV